MSETPPRTAPPAPSVSVSDVRALRALAHPLRTRLLGLLRLHGPATATQLAERVGESSGSTSYHLRQLAAWGFIEELPGHGSARERWWHAPHRSTHWETRDFLDEPGGREVLDELLDRVLAQHRALLSAYAEQRTALDRDWTEAASLNDYVLRVTPGEAHALAEELTGVLARWIARPRQATDADGSVAVLVDLLPLLDVPL